MMVLQSHLSPWLQGAGHVMTIVSTRSWPILVTQLGSWEADSEMEICAQEVYWGLLTASSPGVGVVEAGGAGGEAELCCTESLSQSQGSSAERPPPTVATNWGRGWGLFPLQQLVILEGCP